MQHLHHQLGGLGSGNLLHKSQRGTGAPKCERRLCSTTFSRGPPGYRPAGYPTGPGSRPGGPGGPGGANGGGGLIVPGRGGDYSDGGSDRKLVLPGGDRPAPRSGNSLSGPGLEGLGEKQIQNFRPPLGFMETDPSQMEDPRTTPEAMLQRLRTRAGRWYDLARFLPLLQSMGFDSTAVVDETGLETKLQGIWGASLPVWESLKQSGFPQEKLTYFDKEGEFLLFEIRFLTAQQRLDTAEYIVDNQLNPPECVILARAVKEHERRRAEQEGFSRAPGDVMAYKYYRDAIESRRNDDKKKYVEKGRVVAVTEMALAKLNELEEDASTTAAWSSTRTTVTMLRMLPEEAGFRPVAVAGQLTSATTDAVFSAGQAWQQGPFGLFTVEEGGPRGQQWVALPSWVQVLTAREPVALEIPDCSALPELVSSSYSSSDDDMKRLATPGLLVVDRQARLHESPDPGQYYLVEGGGGKLELVEGASTNGKRLVALVLFCVRPPAREAYEELGENDMGALQL